MDGNSYAKGNIHAIQLTMQAVWQIFAILGSYLMDSDCPDLSELIRTVVNPELHCQIQRSIAEIQPTDIQVTIFL